MGRQPKLIVAVGAKFIGKTYTTLGQIITYAQGNPKKGISPRKVLIFDVNGEFPEFKRLSIKHVAAYSAHPKVDIRRITTQKDDGGTMNPNEMQDALSAILRNYKTGLLLIEDISTYTSDSIGADLVGTLATQRHIGVDVIIHFQTKSKAGHPQIVGMMSLMRIHKTMDNFEKHKGKFTNNLDLLKVAEALVENENSKLDPKKQWFYCYADFDIGKVRGSFNKKQFSEAISIYVSQNEKQIVSPLLNSKDRKGNKIYSSYEQAYNQVEKDLFNKFYGNS